MKYSCIQMVKRFFSAAVCLLVVSGMVFLQGSAAAFTNQFGVKAVIPDNQVDKTLTYFDLRVAPGMEQTIQVKINNSSAESITAYTSVFPATTSRDGVISYSEPGEGARPPVSVDDFCRVRQKEVVIAAGSSQMVDIDIKMSEDEFDGVILGGILIWAEEADASESKNTESALLLENRYQYVVGLRLSQNDLEIKPDFAYEGTKAETRNYRPVFSISLRNLEPYIASGMKLDADIYKDGETAVYKNLSLESASMAPETAGEFLVEAGERITAGDYRLHMVVELDGEKWEWDERFTVSPADVNDMDRDNILSEAGSSNMWLIILIAVLIVLILFLLFFLLWKRRQDKEEKKNKHSVG